MPPPCRLMLEPLMDALFVRAPVEVTETAPGCRSSNR